jgi:hypothetical protein
MNLEREPKSMEIRFDIPQCPPEGSVGSTLDLATTSAQGAWMAQQWSGGAYPEPVEGADAPKAISYKVFRYEWLPYGRPRQPP